MWHSVALHDQVLSVCVVGMAPRVRSIVSAQVFEVLWEPAMSESDTGYPVEESSREMALCACVAWCPV